MLEQDGGTRVALVDVGGFLGVGEKTVAIPFDEMKFDARPTQWTATSRRSRSP